jgi:glycerol-3-phosphate acyltransferase PlsY
MLTAGGMLYGIEPVSISITIASFIGIMIGSRYVSLASIISPIIYPLLLVVLKFVFGYEISYLLLVLAFLLCAFLIYKHKTNIGRLKTGTENKIPAFWKKESKTK